MRMPVGIEILAGGLLGSTGPLFGAGSAGRLGEEVGGPASIRLLGAVGGWFLGLGNRVTGFGGKVRMPTSVLGTWLAGTGRWESPCSARPEGSSAKVGSLATYRYRLLSVAPKPAGSRTSQRPVRG